MAYTFQQMTKVQAEEIAQWRYTEPYSFYNPNEANIEKFVACLLELRYGYHAMYDHAICDGTMLVGFCCFGEDAQVPGGDYDLPNTLDTGLGMRPELTDQGRGAAFLAAILAFAQNQYHVKQFRSTIAQFNLRSQRTFAQAGFQPVQRFLSQHNHATEFVVMVKHCSL